MLGLNWQLANKTGPEVVEAPDWRTDWNSIAFLYFPSFSVSVYSPTVMCLCFIQKENKKITSDDEAQAQRSKYSVLFPSITLGLFIKIRLTSERVIQMSVLKVIYLLISALLIECCKLIHWWWRSVVSFDRTEVETVETGTWCRATTPGFLLIVEKDFLYTRPHWFKMNAEIRFFIFIVHTSKLILINNHSL